MQPCGPFVSSFLLASFLRKANLIVDQASRISAKVPLCSDLLLSSSGVKLRIRATKTIHFNQRELLVPLPTISNSPLCPVTALYIVCRSPCFLFYAMTIIMPPSRIVCFLSFYNTLFAQEA